MKRMLTYPSFLNVLIIDDNSFDSHAATDMLKQLGHEAKAASSYRKAKELLETHRFDLILITPDLRFTNGLKLAEKLLEHYPGLPPMMAISRSREPEMIHKSFKAGMINFLPKPITKENYLAGISMYAFKKFFREKHSDFLKASRKPQ